MTDQSPTLGVGFEIDPAASFASLSELEKRVDQATASAVESFGRMEAASEKVVDTRRAVSSLTDLTTAVTKQAATHTRSYDAVEKAGERLSRQMERQASTFGKSSDEIRRMRVETQALAAEQRGLTELAERLRAQEQSLWEMEYEAARKAQLAARAAAEDRDAAAARAATLAEQEAQRLREAAFAHGLFEARVRAGAVAMREQAAAEDAAATATARLRAMIDPVGAAFDRMNDELAVYRKLMDAGRISAEDLAQAEVILAQRANEAAAAHARNAEMTGAARAGQQQLWMNVNDMATMWAGGAKAGQIFSTQIGQIVQALQLMSMGTDTTTTRMGRLLGLIGGPWGLALASFGLVAGTLASKLMDSGDASDKAAGAHGRNAAAVKSLSEAIAEMNEQLGRAVRTQEQERIVTLNAANAKLAEARAERDRLGAYLATQEARLRQSRAGFGMGNTGTYNVVPVAQQLAIEKLLAANEALRIKNAKDLDKAQQSVTLARIPMLQAEAEAMDKVVAATQRRDRTVERLNDRLIAGTIGERAYVAEMAAANAALKTVQEADRKAAEAKRAHTRALGEQAKASRETERTALQMSGVLDGLTAKYDPATDAAGKYAAVLRDINALYQDGQIGAGDYFKFTFGASRDEREREKTAASAAASRIFGGVGLDETSALIKAKAEERVSAAVEVTNLLLERQAGLWDEIAQNSVNAARGMEEAFGRVGGTLGRLPAIYADFRAEQVKASSENQRRLDLLGKITNADERQAALGKQNARYDAQTATMRVGLYGDMTAAAEGFFKRGTAGYKTLHAAEQVFRAFEFAMSVRSMVQNAAETASKVANSATRAAAAGTEGVAEQSKLPFPANLAAMAATAAALAAAGVAIAGMIGGGGNDLPKPNEGRGTVFGDSEAQSASIKNAIEGLRDIDTMTMTYSREMATSLKTIEGSIGGLTNLIVRTGDVNANAGVAAGFKSDVIGSVLGQVPVLGGLLGSLFGTKTTVVGSGLYGRPQSLDEVLSGGFDASYYSDVQRKKKFLGVTTSTKYSTRYGNASDELEDQFTQVLRGLAGSIRATAGPLGLATDAVQDRLNRFVVDIGKIDLQGLNGEEIRDRLNAVFGAAADDMARAALPGLARYQQVGEGYFETATRVASTVETVANSFDLLGRKAGLGVDASMALAGLFDSAADMQSATRSYFETYYTEAEQAAARTAQLTAAFKAQGVAMPDSIAGYRALVDAQDLTTESGRRTYATLIQMAPAFAELKGAMQDAASAAAILRERQDLDRRYLQTIGDTAALRQLELDRLDASNRARLAEIFALEDQAKAAQDAATAAEALAQKAAQVASQQSSLEGQLLQLQGNTVELRRRELAALDPSIRATQERVWALQDEATAAQAAAQIALQRTALERQIMEAEGRSADIRALDLAALDASLRPLQLRVWSLQDEAAATAEASRIANERIGIENEILQLQGNTVELRRREREALDPANRAIYDQLQALRDQQAAAATAQQAAEEAARAADQLRQTWAGIADDIVEEVKRIRGIGQTGAQTYAELFDQFNAATGKARAGDAEAAKSLTQLSRSLLEAAEENARDPIELRRIQAMTAASLDDTYRVITGLNTAAQIAAGVANDDPTKQPWWSSFEATTAATPSFNANDDTQAELRSLRAEVRELASLLEQIALIGDRSAAVLERAQGMAEGDGLAVKVMAA